jgi:hypothetical protein
MKKEHEFKEGQIVKVFCDKYKYEPHPNFNDDMMDWKKKPMTIRKIWVSSLANDVIFTVNENRWTWVLDDIILSNDIFDDIIGDFKI